MYVVLILAMVVADLSYTTPDRLWEALRSPEIRYAIKLSLVSCLVTTVLSLWVAVPLGYLLSRTRFWGKPVLDTILDIPIVLPPLVIGLSLLILFQTAPGRWIEDVTARRMGYLLTYAAHTRARRPGRSGRWRLRRCARGGPAGHRVAAGLRRGAGLVSGSDRRRVGGLAALQRAWGGTRGDRSGSVRDADHVRGPERDPGPVRGELCVRRADHAGDVRPDLAADGAGGADARLHAGQAFWMVRFPEAWRGIVSAGTLAWARALGEFGPILIFAGATRMRTEVLSTTVFLELSVGRLEAAIAVSLLMVVVAVAWCCC